MITKTSLLARTVPPQVRDYINSCMEELAETNRKNLLSIQQTNEANQNELLKEISDVRGKLNTVNKLIDTDPTHRITKMKLIEVASELGL